MIGPIDYLTFSTFVQNDLTLVYSLVLPSSHHFGLLNFFFIKLWILLVGLRKPFWSDSEGLSSNKESTVVLGDASSTCVFLIDVWSWSMKYFEVSFY